VQPGHDTVQPGSVLGPYEIVELLGAGGMGAVYRARDTRLDREVALKIILPDSTSESTHRRRFLNEAKAVSALNHPNVVTVYEAASIDGVDFIAMELILGETLSVRIGRGAIPIPDAVRLALQVAEGLSAAHQSGLIHRDLKPSNIMITRDGRAKILDFGLAKKTEHAAAATASATLSMLTAAGTAVGTLAYMSPEQARGDVPGPLSDMFTYGTVLYEALTCLRPFDGRTQLDYFHQLCFEDAVPLSTRRPDTPPALIAIITRAMARNPADRFASMASLVDALKVLVMSDAQLAFASSTATMTNLPGYSASWELSGRAKAWRRYSQAGLATIATVAVAVAVYYFARRPFTAPSGPPATLTKMTYDAGLTGYPAISSDGKLLAYASDRVGGNLDIWVQQLGGGQPTRLTKDPADDYEPAFSPDGTHIAYRSDRRGGGVYITPTLSGFEELLGAGGFDPKYSPDGSTLAFWRGYVGGALYPKAAQIVLVSLRTRQQQVFRPDFETAAYPVWLSNSRLLFLGRKRDKTGNAVIDWWVADIDTGYAAPTGALKRFEDGGLTSVPSTYWFKPETHAGGAVFFTATHGDATNVWKIPVSRDGIATGPPTGVTFGASLDSSVSVADQDAGGTVAFSSLSLARNAWKLPLADSGLASGPAQKLLSDEADMSSPTVSVDGQLLALLARDPDGYRIVTFNLANMQRSTIAAIGASRGSLNDPKFPILSGDGKKIVFRRDHIAFMTTVEDGPVTQLIASCGKPSDVTFDGGQVLCDSRDPSERIVLWSHGTTQTLVAQPDGRNTTQFDGNFSPNERWVAYSEGRPSSPERRIMVVPNAPNRKLNADEWIAISDSGDFDISPVWGADGKHIYWVSDKDGFRCIWARPVDPDTARPTGPAFPVAHFHMASQTLRTTSLSASRGFLIFTMTETTGNIWTQQVEGGVK
jgi:serine/threonine protein kinase/Tol biopolymer transport system component